VDRLTAFVAIAHLRLRLEIIIRHPELLELLMPSKLSAARQALDMLRFNVDADSDKLMARIAEVDDRRATVFADAHQSVDEMHGDLGDIDGDLTDLARSNGGPSLKGSSGSSGQGAKPPTTRTDGTVDENGRNATAAILPLVTPASDATVEPPAPPAQSGEAEADVNAGEVSQEPAPEQLTVNGVTTQS
jgi:hypothetical protein